MSLLNTLKNTYAEFDDLSDYLSMDKGTVVFKGRIIFKHITKNHKQFGIQNYKLCVMTGCTYGRADTLEQTGKMQHRYESYIGNSKTSHETVEGVGYKFCMDNFFYSPGLFDDICMTAIKCCGTVI